MTDLAIRTLSVPRPADVANVYELCRQTEEMLAFVDDVANAYEAKAKFAAIDTYLSQTSQDGRARLAATMRRLEARIGELIGEALPNGGVNRNGLIASNPMPLAPKERSEFRLMAAHPDVVEAVIAGSTDTKPPSRRKVIAAIRDWIKTTKQEDEDMEATSRINRVRTMAGLGLDGARIAEELGLSVGYVNIIAQRAGVALSRQSRLGVAERVEMARQLAATGHTSEQIAAKIGLSPNSMSDFRTRNGITVPADAIVGKKRRLDSNRIVNATVESVIGIDQLFDAIDYSALDRSQLHHWVSSLSGAIKSLTTLRDNLKKEQTQ